MTDGNNFLAPMAKAIGQFSDQYERQARLFPALLALIPLLVLVLSLYREKLGLLSSVVSVLTMCGGLFMLSEIARRRGKAKEQVLWNMWGGAPSTQVLRHSDATFDPVSTKRYHSTLEKKMNLSFPSVSEEAADPHAADAIYTSAGHMLRDATRDTKKFGLLFKDNISYGFRRNGFGLKPIGVAICFGSIIWVVIRHGLSVWATRIHGATDLESFLSGEELTTVTAALTMLLVWFCYFTEQTVREAAFSYAQKLILTCESLAIPPKTPRSVKEKPLTESSSVTSESMKTNLAAPEKSPSSTRKRRDSAKK